MQNPSKQIKKIKISVGGGAPPTEIFVRYEIFQILSGLLAFSNDKMHNDRNKLQVVTERNHLKFPYSRSVGDDTECKMDNRKKVITMTKLALYDKHEGAADRAANEYFRHDYIYKKNLGTRLAVGVAGVLILLIYWLRIILLDGMDVLQMDIQSYLTDSVLFLVALLAVYSLIGTIQGTREYYLIQKRLENYNFLVRQLENHENRTKKRSENEEGR